MTCQIWFEMAVPGESTSFKKDDLDLRARLVAHDLQGAHDDATRAIGLDPQLGSAWGVRAAVHAEASRGEAEAGLDPKKTTIVVQSHVPAHCELHLLLSMITPLGWLERVPTYKDQQEKLSEKDLSTYGFLGYPLLQAADILIYRAKYVPVGEDQAPHIEFTREVVRSFNFRYNTSALIEHDVSLSLITARDPEGLEILRHSTAHLLAQAARMHGSQHGQFLLELPDRLLTVSHTGNGIPRPLEHDAQHFPQTLLIINN